MDGSAVEFTNWAGEAPDGYAFYGACLELNTSDERDAQERGRWNEARPDNGEWFQLLPAICQRSAG